MGQYIDKLIVAFSSADDSGPSKDKDTPGDTTIPFDVNDVIANVKNLRDGDLLALDKAVDQEIAGRGLPDPDDD